MNTTLRSLVLVSIVAFAAAAASAQTKFTGIITGDNVHVRANAGENYYSVGKVNKDDLVEVDNIFYDWYEVKPLGGAFCFIAKEYVKAEADGKSGTVSDNAVRVRAPSPAGPDAS